MDVSLMGRIYALIRGHFGRTAVLSTRRVAIPLIASVATALMFVALAPTAQAAQPPSPASLAVSGLTSVAAGTQQTVTVRELLFGFPNVFYRGTVVLTSTDAQAALPARYTFTAADHGVHSFAVTLKTSGSQTVTATDAAVSAIKGSQTVTVSAAAAKTLSLSGLGNQTAGASQSPVLTVRDAFHNIATGYRGQVHFSSTDGVAGLPTNYRFTASDAGTHTFTKAVMLKTAGAQTVTATDTATSTLTASQTVTISPGPAASLGLTGLANGPAGVPQSPVLTVRDAFHNVATGYRGRVHFTSTDGHAVLPVDYTFTAGDAGTHTFTNAVTLKTAGAQTVTATDSAHGLVISSPSLTITPAAALTLRVTNLAGAVAGTLQSAIVTAYDAYGNVAAGYLGTVHFTSTDLNAVLPGDYTFTAADAGTHTFTNEVTLITAAAQTVTATDAAHGLVGSSPSLTITPAAAQTLQVTGPADKSVVAGTPQSATVTAYDAYGNVAAGYLGTVHFTSTDLNAVLPGDYTFTAADAGTHTFTNEVTLITAAAQETVAVTDTATITLAASQTVAVGPAATVSINATINESAVSAIDGQTVDFSVTVNAVDQYGNNAPPTSPVNLNVTNSFTDQSIFDQPVDLDNGPVTMGFPVLVTGSAIEIAAFPAMDPSTGILLTGSIVEMIAVQPTVQLNVTSINPDGTYIGALDVPDLTEGLVPSSVMFDTNSVTTSGGITSIPITAETTGGDEISATAMLTTPLDPSGTLVVGNPGPTTSLTVTSCLNGTQGGPANGTAVPSGVSCESGFSNVTVDVPVTPTVILSNLETAALFDVASVLCVAKDAAPVNGSCGS